VIVQGTVVEFRKVCNGCNNRLKRLTEECCPQIKSWASGVACCISYSVPFYVHKPISDKKIDDPNKEAFCNDYEPSGFWEKMTHNAKEIPSI
jgi:hypothetical protein